ncbi:MAG: ferredoxin [Ferruginibacter sp.]|uniref:2Fe-2S iron-sulfur cluster-binding protein n=1 Tax=Ferruginibacter sp. TaxID=1940288 RepID=UPI00265A4741|nr:2Fe-2S iron-sulfur cluster-binding protein [Ferruginibacter sp.]MDB5276579.1 ferredoxin [Ferruginibacter sp.]
MNDERKEIAITLINAGEAHVVKTYLHQYRNLMMLLNNTIYLENFGECGGQGRCATCMVKAVGLKGNANSMERNEAATIGKAGLADEAVRLSCQILISEDLNGAVIEITGDEY